MSTPSVIAGVAQIISPMSLYPSPYNLAIVHLGLGHYEQAIDWLEEAYEAHNSHLLYTNQGPRFDPLRENERFIGLLERFEW